MGRKDRKGAAAPFKITRVLVIEQHGTDLVRLETDLPLAVFPYDGSPQMLSMEVSKGMGVQYVRDNFDIEPEVIRI